MRCTYAGTVCREGMTVRYALLSGGAGGYGILVEKGTERTAVPDLSRCRNRVLELIARMGNDFVTPVTARDIAEDWLLEQA